MPVIELKRHDYYLYKLIRNKINGAHFLNVVQKNNYISKYVTAIRDCFMVGVRRCPSIVKA